jgi:predicted  nucleic acid-binding Zn-ribbon protein
VPESPPLLKASRAKKIRIDGEERFLKTCAKCGAESYLREKQTRAKSAERRRKNNSEGLFRHLPQRARIVFEIAVECVKYGPAPFARREVRKKFIRTWHL